MPEYVWKYWNMESVSAVALVLFGGTHYMRTEHSDEYFFSLALTPSNKTAYNGRSSC